MQKRIQGSRAWRNTLIFLGVMITSLVFALPQAQANPADPAETRVYITQSGGSNFTDGTTISAAEFTELLNQQVMGSENTVYVLVENITISASALSRDYFVRDETSLNYHNFQFVGSMEGRELLPGVYPTITIDTASLPQGQTARTLFGHINEKQPAANFRPYSIKNFNVCYTGSVGVSAFSRGNIRSTNITNIGVEVKGNIVAEHNHFNGNLSDNLIVASGFAIYAEGGAENFNDGYRESCRTTLKDIRVKAHDIGNKELLPGQVCWRVSGLVDTVYPGINLQNIYVDFQNMYLMTPGNKNEYGTISGIYGFFNAQMAKRDNVIMDNLHVNVAGNMHQTTTEYAIILSCETGVYGISSDLHVLTNSSVNVGGSMIAESLANPQFDHHLDDVTVAVIGSTTGGSMVENTFSNNTATIGGSLIARARGTTMISLGLTNFYRGWYDRNIRFSTENTHVTIGGDVICERIGPALSYHNSYRNKHSFVTGVSCYMESSVNDHVEVMGNVRVAHEGGDPRAVNGVYFTGHSFQASHIEGGSAIYHGTIDLQSGPGSVRYYGFTSALSTATATEIHDNVMRVDGNVTLNSGAGGGYALADGFISGMGQNDNCRISNNRVLMGGSMRLSGPIDVQASGFTASAERGTIENNAVSFAGGISAQGTNSATVAGFTIFSGAGASFNGNAVRIDGGITATEPSGKGEAAGFITYNNGSVSQNTLLVNGGIAADSAGGFVAYNTGIANRNTAFVKDGLTATTSATFSVYNYAGSDASENTVIAKPGVPELWQRFMYWVEDGALIGNNYFTSALNGERVSNLLVYEPENYCFSLASYDAQDQLMVSDASDFSAGAQYLTASDIQSGLALDGLDAPSATLASDILTAPMRAALELVYTQGGIHQAKDLPGIGHPYAGNNVTGVVYADNAQEGSVATPLAGVTITVDFGDGHTASAVTDAQGAYSIPVPLLSAQPRSFTVTMETPAGCTLCQSATNAFINNGAITPASQALTYANDYVFNGGVDVPAPPTETPTVTPPSDSPTTPPTSPATPPVTPPAERPSAPPATPTIAPPVAEVPESPPDPSSPQLPPTPANPEASAESPLVDAAESTTTAPAPVQENTVDASTILEALTHEHNVPTITLGGIEIPLGAGPLSDMVWALANLVLALVGMMLALVIVLRALLKRRSEAPASVRPSALQGSEDYREEQSRQRAGNHLLLIAVGTIISVALALAGVILFILTEDMSCQIVLTDSWTPVQAAILLTELVAIVFVFVARKKESFRSKQQTEA